MLNEQKMAHRNRVMKCSIAAYLFMAHLGMSVEGKLEKCLKHFVLWKEGDVHLLSTALEQGVVLGGLYSAAKATY